MIVFGENQIAEKSDKKYLEENWSGKMVVIEIMMVDHLMKIPNRLVLGRFSHSYCRPSAL